MKKMIEWVGGCGGLLGITHVRWIWLRVDYCGGDEGSNAEYQWITLGRWMSSGCRTDVEHSQKDYTCGPRIILRLRMLDGYLGASLMREGPCASRWATGNSK